MGDKKKSTVEDPIKGENKEHVFNFLTRVTVVCQELINSDLHVNKLRYD